MFAYISHTSFVAEASDGETNGVLMGYQNSGADACMAQKTCGREMCFLK